MDLDLGAALAAGPGEGQGDWAQNGGRERN